LANGSHRFIISAEAGGKLNVGLSDICRRSISEREQSAPQNGGENQILPTVPAIDLGRREDCAAIPQKPTPKEQEKSRNQAGSHFGAAFYACKIDCSQGEQPRESQDDRDSRVVPLCPGWAARAARTVGHGSLRSGYQMKRAAQAQPFSFVV